MPGTPRDCCAANKRNKFAPVCPRGPCFAVRQIYTDAEEVLFSRAPIVLNGIEDESRAVTRVNVLASF